eukprot:CAMPEP_0172408352 /NCGR_PEP_ID=MMETSP1061-20121228/75807_1 /TAXON_ID=37318 /ORGANISM="Pseudo-nitzschia pungens, Strain cf. pungens" /LENGTH=39 /DNA_ID= /DNA_START= /DNA_END= /DNA_ORIENTATION=
MLRAIFQDPSWKLGRFSRREVNDHRRFHDEYWNGFTISG